MDCIEFNDLLSEYETNRLSLKQEQEFLQHKDNCPDCNSLYNLVFNQDLDSSKVKYNFQEVYDTDLTVSVMDKIQDIECKGYNFKMNNILNIVFFVIFSIFAIFIMLNYETSAFTQSSFSFLDNCVGSVEHYVGILKESSISFMALYSVLVVYIFIAFVVSVLVSFVNDMRHQ